MTTLILKPTDACNAKCRYCSAAKGAPPKAMAAEVLSQVFTLFGNWSQRFDSNRLKLIWHGGEPLLMPPEFWEQAFRLEEEILLQRGIVLEQGIQTNATRITPETLPLLKRLLGPRGTVGTSADPLPGIRELKGQRRGLYAEKWESAMGLLRGAGIRYGILYVVHRESLPHLKEIYSHFRTHHPEAGIRFNPLYRQGRAAQAEAWEDLGITSEEWGQALIELHQAWDEDGRPGNVLPFGPWWRLREKGHWGLSCECSGKCVDSHFGVGPDGSIFLCGRSSDGDSFRFGHVADLDIDALHRNPQRQLLSNRRVYLRRTACRDCPWWLYCHGGCVNDGLLESGTAFAPTSFCTGLRTYFDEAFGGESAS
jgi:uncharacterized protein